MTTNYKPDFWGESYEDIDDRLYTFGLVACNKYKLNRDFAEEIKQELWVKVLLLAKRYQPDHESNAKFSTYIAKWMREISLRYARKEKKRYFEITETQYTERHIPLDDATDVAQSYDIDHGMDIKQLLKDLDPVLVMKGMDLSDVEIAEILEVPVSHVTQARREAYKELTK